MNRVGENVTSIEEYDVASINTSTYAVSGLSLVGTMRYSFDSDGKQFRKKYVAADGTEQKYVFEYQDEQNVAVQLPTGVVSHAKSDHLGRKVFDELQLGKGLMNHKCRCGSFIILGCYSAIQFCNERNYVYVK